MRRRILAPIIVVLSAILSTQHAIADDSTAGGCASVDRSNVARCVIAASPTVHAEREGVEAARGRRVAASPWFPANPTLTGSLAQRSGTEGRNDTINYAASLSQEIEIAGQRSARRRAADYDVSARSQDVIAATRRTAALAYIAFFDVLAARDALAVARRLEATARQIATVTASRADAGVASRLDAEVTEAASLRVVQGRIAAERDVATSSSALAGLLGRDPTHASIVVNGALEPLSGSDALVASAASTSSRAVRDRPEVRALTNEQRSYEERAAAFRRARFPSLTLQVFAQNDGYNERVLGAGLAIPIPLPQPVGRLYTGEIAESEALARQVRDRSEIVARSLSTELATAISTYETRRAEAALYTNERVTRSEQLMAEIGKEIEAGRLPVRDAVVAQQQLIDVLRGHIDTRRALCRASVELALAAGVPLEAEAR